MKEVLLAAVISGPEHDVVSIGPVYIQVYLSDIWTVIPPHFPKKPNTFRISLFYHIAYFISSYLPFGPFFTLLISSKTYQRVPRNLLGTPCIFVLR